MTRNEEIFLAYAAVHDIKFELNARSNFDSTDLDVWTYCGTFDCKQCYVVDRCVPVAKLWWPEYERMNEKYPEYFI